MSMLFVSGYRDFSIVLLAVVFLHIRQLTEYPYGVHRVENFRLLKKSAYCECESESQEFSVVIDKAQEVPLYPTSMKQKNNDRSTQTIYSE
jgi:hypothetical protein